MTKNSKILGLGLLLALFVSGCASTSLKTISINQPSVKAIAKTNVATAGATIVDITPPPGFSMGGYSLMGSVGQGFRTKLKARIIYLNDGKGDALALVQTDLGSGSSLVQHKVMELIAQKTGLAAHQILISATHTHSGPVNFFNNDFYNKHFGANPGLEVEFYNLTAQRIADGIIKAYETRKRAKIATGRKDFYGINRNRSIVAYSKNTTVGNVDLNDANSVFKHVNPTMNMIRIDVEDKGSFKPLAAFASFSVHATSINPDVVVYNADLFAYAQRDLQWFVKDKYKPSWEFAHALITANQGDMAPAVPLRGDNYVSHHPVDWPSSKKVGQKLGRAAIELFESLGKKLTSDLTLTSAAREIDISKNNKINGTEICDIPMVGSALAGGAFEHRTPGLAIIPGIHGGWATRRLISTSSCQGEKLKLGGSRFQRIIEPTHTFPKLAFFQAHQINDMLLLTAPFEITIESARRMVIKARSEYEKRDKSIKYAWVASVSNGYFGYTTTPEEYSYQEYEGGHTLYGKYSTPYITEHLGELAGSIAAGKPIVEILSNWKYDLQTAKYMPKQVATTGQRKALNTPKFFKGENDYDEDYMLFKWQDAEPSKIHFEKHLVKVEVYKNGTWQTADNNGEVLDDEGYDLEVRYLADESGDLEKDGMAVYQVRWYNPVKGGKYRISIEPRFNFAKLYSPEFNY